MKSGINSFGFIALALGAFSQARAVCYVNNKAIGSNDGTSWGAAYSDLQSALRNTACLEVWVAKGVYKPTADVDRSVSFNVNSGVAVYGGFAGRESTRGARNPAANITVLSGDVDDDDTNAASNQVDVTWKDIQGYNSYHVVWMDGTSGTLILADTVLDGFTITGGNASGSYPDADGSGLYCNGSGAGHVCSPTLSNLVFSGNSAVEFGTLFNNGFFGGVSSPSLMHVVFRGNFAIDGGGAIYDSAAFGGTSSPNLIDVIFDANLSLDGSGMYNDGSFAGNSSPFLNQTTFSKNGDGSSGGAIYNNGESGRSNPTLINTTFIGNSANAGNAMYNNGTGSGQSNPTLTNVTFSNNVSGSSGHGVIYDAADGSGESSPMLTNVTFSNNNETRGVLYVSAGSGTTKAVLRNVIMWGDSPLTPEIDGDAGTIIDHSIIQGGCPSGTSCTNLIAADPLLSSLSDHGGFTWTALPDARSPAIDTGDDNPFVCPATDQRGIARPQGVHCDIGALERQRVEDIIFRDGFERF